MIFDSPFGIHEQALKVFTQRNEVLASNIANADTPGYKARDVNFQEMLKDQKDKPPTMEVAKSYSRHIQAGQARQNFIPTEQYVFERQATQASEDGNTVDINKEQLEYAKNLAYFEATTRFLNGKISGIKTALGKG